LDSISLRQTKKNYFFFFAATFFFATALLTGFFEAVDLVVFLAMEKLLASFFLDGTQNF
jgi:hypothetical protein